MGTIWLRLVISTIRVRIAVGLLLRFHNR